MLEWLHIRNVALIEQVEIDLAPGLNLLTGETGAGKSILVDALGLALGARSSPDLIRSGADSASVEAGFLVDRGAAELTALLDAACIDWEEGSLTIRREINRAGRGRVAVNGAAGANALLRDMAPFLADIHGQGEVSFLHQAAAGLDVLDAVVLGEDAALGPQVGALYASLVRLEQEISDLRKAQREREARRDMLSYQLGEIEQAAPQPGEDRELASERSVLAHGEKLRALAEEAHGLLYESDGSVLSQLAQVWKRLSELGAIDPRFQPYLAARESLDSQLEDLAFFLRDYGSRVDFTPGRLDQVESRLAELERLTKKYGGTLEAVLRHAEQCRRALSSLETAADREAGLTAERDEVARGYLEAAKRLSQRRKAAARRLEKDVLSELGDLAMEKSRFSVTFAEPPEEPEDRSRWSARGIDAVELLFSANPGEELRPLARVASGGELSRFMLALKSVAARGELPKTLVFDEVDAGIGGRVAEVVGRKLKELSRFHQVVCVTHLPQIARFADAHFRISKRQAKGRTLTVIERLTEEGRVNEVARMIAGETITETARRHAEQLVTEKPKVKL
jgi:DNA repair protein RecN (Recombination protein N)